MSDGIHQQIAVALGVGTWNVSDEGEYSFFSETMGGCFALPVEVGARILALHRAASAGRECRDKLEEVASDTLNGTWPRVNELRRVVREYDLATSPSGEPSGDGGEVG